MEERAFSRRGPESVTDLIKVPPQSVEAEQSVLGGLLLLTAVVRKKRTVQIRSPYAERVPLTTLSPGFVVPDDAAGMRP